MVRRIFLYIDRIFAMVRPRKVLYMAIDGVAPRAKMNQQRSRRFRSAKEVSDKEAAEEELRQEWIEKGMEPPPPRRRPWDSNVITPGTPFMAALSRSIHWYIYDRMTNDAGWKGIKVIFSDAKVPGEGEHKIMQYIRRQRASPGYDPNTKHTLYGMDADLIMLGLATHDPWFFILRETITDTRPMAQGPRCFICGVQGHRAEECSGVLEEELKKAEASGKIPGASPEPGLMEKPFQFLQLNVLREYLAHDLYVPNLPFAWDLERCIDDFVFLAFFVGNDFLPHLPLLEIREGAIERLVGIYKRLLPSLGGYLSEDAGQLNFSRVDVLLSDLGLVEDSIFKSRKSKEEFFKKRDENRSAQLATRRAQTMKARESAASFAAEQGFTAVKSGINISGKAIQPHIKQRAGVKQEVEIKMQGEGEPVYEEKQVAGKKRKSTGDNEGETEAGESTSAAAPSEDEPAAKKKKLMDGLVQQVRAKAKKAKKAASMNSSSSSDSGEEDESDAEDPSDPSFKPGKEEEEEEEEEESEEDSDDDEAEKRKKQKKANARKAKQAAAKAKAKAKAKSATSTAAASSPSIKSEDEPMPSSSSVPGATLDAIKSDSSGALAAKLDAASSSLDFGALLNAKLKALERPPQKEGEEEDRDPVRFGEEGWKGRYYAAKMHMNRDRPNDGVLFHHLFKSYAEGLQWVMSYYYSGCTSWSWYYPFHYGEEGKERERCACAL
jgi:5'-3' exoribonuclease 2